MKRLWLICFLSMLAAGLVFSGAGTVCAQESEEEKEEILLEDIVVTANRVESLASKTPVSITAVTGETIDQTGLLDPTMLEEMVPGLIIDRNQGSTRGLQITIRGVSSSDNTEKGDASAAFMIDDVYFGRQLSHDINFYDVERVEVLRGPQGTLYGRNTTAGVVNVITKKPQDIFEAGFAFTVGNFGTIMGSGIVNTPITDNLAVRTSFQYQRRDNIINTPNSRLRTSPIDNDVSLRLQAKYDFNEDVSLLLKFDYSDIKGATWRSARTADFSRLYYYDANNPDDIRYIGDLSNDEILYDDFESTQPYDSSVETKGIKAELNWDLGPVALTYLGSYHEMAQGVYFAFHFGEPAGYADFIGDYWQTHQEVRLATTGDGPFTGQMGAYYFYETSGIAFYLYNFGPFAKMGWPQDPTVNEAYAVYGQGTYELTPSLRFTAGLRYSNDTKSRKGFTHQLFASGLEIFLVNDADVSFDKTTYRVALDYDLTDKTLLYGYVATGYKAGGFNDGCESTTPGCNYVRDDYLFFGPENNTAYEIGIKARLWDKLILNGAAFRYDYTDLQLTTVVDIDEVVMTYTTNAGASQVDGVEIESVYYPTPNNRFEATVAWLDATFTDYIASNQSQTRVQDWAGRPLARSPEWTMLLGYRYQYPLANGGDITTSLRYRWMDDFFLTDTGTPLYIPIPGYHKTNLSMTYTAPENAWYFQVYGENLEDEISFSGVSTRGTVTPLEPRTYGIRAGFRF